MSINIIYTEKKQDKDLRIKNILKEMHNACKQFVPSPENFNSVNKGATPIQFGLVYQKEDYRLKDKFIISLRQEVVERTRFFLNNEKIVKKIIINSSEYLKCNYPFKSDSFLIIDHKKLVDTTHNEEELSEVQFLLRGISVTNKAKRVYLVHVFPSNANGDSDEAYRDFSINCDLIFKLS